MAFSTQKDFFDVLFMKESSELDCKKACVKLKSYESTDDARAWASDDMKQSKFLNDLVTCEIGEGEGDFNKTERQAAYASRPRHVNTNDCIGKRKQGAYIDSEVLASQLSTGDSLLQCANVHLTEYQKLLKINIALETQLEVSNEHLATAKEENKKIQDILASKLDSNTAKDFYNKIQKLNKAGKLNRNEENEMLQFYEKMKNLIKSYEVLQAKNNYLECFLEKLNRRVTLESITNKPEDSKDIDYLQNEINSLRKECILLRQIEEDYEIRKQQQSMKLPSITEKEAENIKAIMKERNILREKCKSFKALEQEVKQLEHKTLNAKREVHELNNDLANKTQFINEMEKEMEKMQKYYEERKQNSCLKEDYLKAQIAALKDDVDKAKNKADMLGMEGSCLRNEILKRDLAINDYDCQYKQLMGVVNELQSVKLQCLHDNETQTYKEQTDELTFYTCATLEEILKEFKKRGCFDNQLLSVDGYSSNKEENETHCCQEVELLKEQINELKNIMREKANCEEICKDALDRLKELETENSQLLHDNEDLSEKLKEDEKKLTKMLEQLENLDLDINKNGQEAIKIGKDLEGTISLVKDISYVQLKNQQLGNAVSAINSRDDQKIIDDLRRQLEEELAKLNKCQNHNARLLEEAELREMSLKKLKDINNQLLAENVKLKTENENKIEEKTDKAKYMEKSDKSIPNESEEDRENVNSHKDKAEVKSKPPKTSEKIKGIPKQTNYEENKQWSQVLEKSASKVSSGRQRPTSSSHQKLIHFTDSDGFATTSSTETSRNKPKVTQPKTKNNNIIETSAPKTSVEPQFKHSDEKAAHLRHDQRKDLALDAFVNKKSDTLKLNLQKGRCFEKEFRKILEEFILECSNYFCSLFNAKSNLYTICHKLCHNGLDILNFQELAYIHRKIYNQADKLLPGCLLDMILTDHREQVETILTSVVMPRLLQSSKLNYKTSYGNVCDEDQKYCCSKNQLCSGKSEEVLKAKVTKLEKDISIAREYLETLRNIPLGDNLTTESDDSTETNNSTYRALSPVLKQQKICYPKHVKKLKTRAKN